LCRYKLSSLYQDVNKNWINLSYDKMNATIQGNACIAPTRATPSLPSDWPVCIQTVGSSSSSEDDVSVCWSRQPWWQAPEERASRSQWLPSRYSVTSGPPSWTQLTPSTSPSPTSVHPQAQRCSLPPRWLSDNNNDIINNTFLLLLALIPGSRIDALSKRCYTCIYV